MKTGKYLELGEHIGMNVCLYCKKPSCTFDPDDIPCCKRAVCQDKRLMNILKMTLLRANKVPYDMIVSFIIPHVQMDIYVAPNPYFVSFNRHQRRKRLRHYQSSQLCTIPTDYNLKTIHEKRIERDIVEPFLLPFSKKKNKMNHIDSS